MPPVNILTVRDGRLEAHRDGELVYTEDRKSAVRDILFTYGMFGKVELGTAEFTQKELRYVLEALVKFLR